MTWSLARTTQLSLCSTEFTAGDKMSWPSVVQRGENRTREIILDLPRAEMSFVTFPCWRNPTISKQQTTVTAHSHCTGPGQRHEPGNDWFLYYVIYCTHYTGTGVGTIVFYCTHPGPCNCPGPGPVQCVFGDFKALLSPQFFSVSLARSICAPIPFPLLFKDNETVITHCFRLSVLTMKHGAQTDHGLQTKWHCLYP